MKTFTKALSLWVTTLLLWGTLSVGNTAPRSPEVVNTGPNPPVKIALTFDIEAPSGQLSAILDVLAEHNVKGTFFILGTVADQGTNVLLPRITASGHDIANHSYSHPNFPKLSKEQMREEIINGQMAIQRAVNRAPSLFFRPPYGEYDNHTLEALKDLGYTYLVMWSIDPKDWAGTPPEQMAEIILQNVKPGSIVLFHDFKPNTPATLKMILPQLQARGYQCVTISELLGEK
jgi:peptidoglycan/xylan/chitin deacetylase (PgdA/CDA1 family)